ncbi:hypothetical protein D3C72_1846100 [compost metagenome]
MTEPPAVLPSTMGRSSRLPAKLQRTRASVISWPSMTTRGPIALPETRIDSGTWALPPISPSTATTPAMGSSTPIADNRSSGKSATAKRPVTLPASLPFAEAVRRPPAICTIASGTSQVLPARWNAPATRSTA